MKRSTCAIVLVLAGLVTIGAGFGAATIRPQVDFVDAVPDSPQEDAYRELLQEIDGVRFIAAYQASAGANLRSDEAFDLLVYEQQALTNHMYTAFPDGTFTHTLSVYEAMRSGNYMFMKFATAGNARDEDYALPSDPARWQSVRDTVRDDAGSVLAEDGSSALMLFFFATKDQSEARAMSGQAAEALANWNDHSVTLAPEPSGLLYSSYVTDERNVEEMTTWGIAAAVGSMLALLWVVRRAGNVAITITTLLMALLWTFGFMGFIGWPISFLTFIVAPLVVSVGMDYVIHFLHRYEELGSVREATAAAGPPLLLAGGTTILCVGLLGFVSSPLFAQVAIVSAIGLAIALALALSVAPALRELLPQHRSRLSSFPLTGKKRVAPLLVAAGLVAIAIAVAATSTTIESGSAENEFPQDDPVIVLQQRIESEYGAFQRAYLIWQGDISEPALLQGLLAASRDAIDLPLARNSSSVVDFLLANEATNEGVLDIATGQVLDASGRSEEERLPQTRLEAKEQLDALFEDPLWRTLAPFTINREYTLAVVAIELNPWENQQELLQLQQALNELATSYQYNDTTIHAAGAPINRAAVLEATPSNVVLATLGSTITVTVVLLAAWSRKPHGVRLALGAGAMVAACSAILLGFIPVLDWMYGIIHDQGGPRNVARLNDMFLLAFAVTVGVGVDDWVHMSHGYWKQGAKAWQTTGRAITGTTLTTGVAFLILTGVYFLQSKNLAILTALGIGSAYALSVIALPWLLPTQADRSLK